MFDIGQIVIHKDHGVCIIKDKDHVSYLDKDYFILYQIDQVNTKIMVPVDSIQTICRLLISKTQALELIKKFNLIDGDYIVDNKKRKEEYTKLLKSGDLEDLIYLIKILEKLFKDKKHVNKAIGTIDSSLYNEAKNKLYQELSYVLDMNYDAIDSLLNNR